MGYVAPLGAKRWQELIDEFDVSNQTIKEFCLEKNISKSAFLENRKKSAVGFIKIPGPPKALFELSAKLLSTSLYIELKRHA